MVNQGNIELKELRRIEVEIATLVEMDHDIVKIYYKELNQEIDLRMAREQTQAICKLRNHKPSYIILNFLDIEVVFSNKARDHFATDPEYASVRLSQAIIYKGLAQKMVANFYKSYHKPTCPVGLFSNEKDAIVWTLSLQR